MKLNLRQRVRMSGLLLLTGSITFQFGIGACRGLTEFFNPCGTVFAFCDAEDVDFLNRTIPDFEDDPTCTIPFACGDSPFGSGPGPRPSGPP